MRPWLALLLVLHACADKVSVGPQVTRVEPAEAPSGTRTALTLFGEDFFPEARVSHDRAGDSALSSQFQAQVGDVPLEEVAWVGSQTLTAVLPPVFSPGTFDLTIVDPVGRTASLASAFTVADRSSTSRDGWQCAADQDCVDACHAAARCTASRCVVGPSDRDADGDGAVDAACPGGTDCDDTPAACGAACFPGNSEGPPASASCSDGRDNDCDGKTDAADATCGVNTAPVLAASATPRATFNFLPISTSTTGTADVETPPANLVWSWDWTGDGVADSTSSSPTFSFPSSGVHRIGVTVTDTGGLSASRELYVATYGLTSLVLVTTAADENNAGATPLAPGGTGLSLREALKFAEATAGTQTVVFGQTTTLTSKLPVLSEAGGTHLVAQGGVIDGTGLAPGTDCLELGGIGHRVVGGEIRYCPGAGLRISGADIQVIDTHLHHNGTGVVIAGSTSVVGPGNTMASNVTAGASVEAAGAMVVGNSFSGQAASALVVKGAGSGSSVVGNLFYDNATGVTVEAGVSGLALWHNTLHAQTSNGVSVAPAAAGLDVRNNLVTQSGGWGLSAGQGSFAALDKNDFFANGAGACSGCSSLGAGALAVDPLYRDAAARDLVPRPWSPVLDRGAATGTDRNGVWPGLFGGTAPDLGAVEVR